MLRKIFIVLLQVNAALQKSSAYEAPKHIYEYYCHATEVIINDYKNTFPSAIIKFKSVAWPCSLH